MEKKTWQEPTFEMLEIDETEGKALGATSEMTFLGS